MLRENLNSFKKLVFVADLCLVALAFQLSVYIDDARYGLPFDVFSADNLLLPAVLIWGLVYWYQPKCYSFRLRRTSEIISSSLKSCLIASGLFLAFIFTMGYLGESRTQIILFAALTACELTLLRMAIASFLAYYRARGYNTRNVLIVGTGTIAKNFADRILSDQQYGLNIIGFADWERRPDLWRYRDIPCVGYLDDLPKILKQRQIDWVVFAVGRRFLATVEKSLTLCEQMGVQVAVLADFFPIKLAKKRIDSFFDSPMVCYHTGPAEDFRMIIKDLFDRVMAGIGLILASPVMLAVGLAIKLTSKGPAIFKQQRCGKNGRKFALYKFRTMVDNAEELKKDLMKFNEMDGPAFKMKNDPRITPIGRVLRKTSLDELPQLFNILKGDMSFVGPRPPLAEEVAKYDPPQRRKLSVKPGLTCLWQVSGRSDIPFEKWMQMDLEYIDNWSLWQDMKILAKTFPAVIKGTGAR